MLLVTSDPDRKGTPRHRNSAAHVTTAPASTRQFLFEDSMVGASSGTRQNGQFLLRVPLLLRFNLRNQDRWRDCGDRNASRFRPAIAVEYLAPVGRRQD